MYVFAFLVMLCNLRLHFSLKPVVCILWMWCDLILHVEAVKSVALTSVMTLGCSQHAGKNGTFLLIRS